MEITQKMSPEELEEFREYQKNKSELGKKFKLRIAELRADYDELASAILDGLRIEEVKLYENNTPTVTRKTVDIIDQKNAVKAYELAAKRYE
ncbi:MAG: hypothetical protein IJP67_02420 [Oscillospiraceae bacterium]|nr:hypothetical protein [Oscillospiraceae bacterium]